MVSWINKHRTFLYVLAGYAVGFVYYIFFKSTDLFGPHDGRLYHDKALESMATGIGACGLYSHSYWTPGWVETVGLIYRIFGANPKFVHVFNLIVILGEALLLYLLAGRIWARAAVAAPVLFMTSMLVLKHSSFLQYELFLGFLMTLLLFLLVRFVRRTASAPTLAFLIGAVVVLTMLLSAKAVGVVGFVFVASLWRLWPQKRYGDLTVLVMSSALLLSVWVFRNYQCFNEFIPLTTNGGVVFYIGNNPNTDNTSYNDPYASLDESQKDIEVWEQKKWYGLAFKYIAENPGLTVKRVALRFLSFFNPHYGEQIVVILLFLIGLYQVLWRRRAHWRSLPMEYVFVQVAVFSLIFLHAVYVSSHRYVLLVWPFMALAAAGAFAKWRFRGESER